MMRSAFLATLVVGAVAAQGSAQAPPTPPDHYALTNARIVTAPGRVIERGTVVMRDGRIRAVGPQVDIPAAAIRMDLEGMTVYAGLIDAATTVGLPTVTPQGGPGQGGASAPATEVAPSRAAADVYAPSAADLEAVRNAGFTTLGLAFDGGIFPGRTAVVQTAGDAPVLRTPVAQQVLLGRRRGQYPGTLMASIAFVQQAFLDTRHDMRVRQAWDRQPTGPRPEYRPDVRALEDAATGTLPVWFVAGAERDIKRIIDLAAELDIRDYVIVGAQEGWRVIDALRGAARPVIVSLDWPNVSQVSGRAFELHVAPASGPDDAGAAADSAVARQLRGNAAAIARAGVPFALSSYGMNSPAQLRSRVRAAVSAGLAPEDALRALTITPATLLGVDDVVGTIETGKLANLVVTQGDIFAPDSRVRHVFVEGVRHDVPAPAERGGARAAGAADAGSVVAGEFVGEVDGQSGLVQFALTIRGSGDQLTGQLTSDLGAVALTGEQDGNEFTLRGTVAPSGMTAMAVTVTGSVTGDDLRGALSVQGMSPITITARRRTPGGHNGEASR
jgi:imidazolonepropionase-like amidohydrolase